MTRIWKSPQTSTWIKKFEKWQQMASITLCVSENVITGQTEYEEWVEGLQLRSRCQKMTRTQACSLIGILCRLSSSLCYFQPRPLEMGQEEVGGCTWRAQTTCLCLGSVVERPWLAQGHFFPFWYKQTWNKPSHMHLAGLPFPAFKACFSASISQEPWLKVY